MPDPDNLTGNHQNNGRRIKFTIKDFFFILIVLLTELGCNISVDTPGALENAIRNNYKLSAYQFSLLYSLYYIPTILFNGFSGFLIDRIMGIKLSTFVYCIVGIVGLALFSAGGISSLFWLMIFGRLVFGLGNELSTNVCVNYCIFYWYRNSIMNIVSSISNDGAVAGTTIMYQIAPRILEYLKNYFPEKESLNIVIVLGSALYIVTSALAITLTFLKPNDTVNQQTNNQQSQNNEKKATFKDIIRFPLVYWFLFCLNFLNGLLNCFSNFTQGLLTSKEFNLSVPEASNAVAAMGIVKIALSLPISLSVDFVGRNTWYVMTSQLIGAMAYLLFVLRLSPYAGLVLVGLSNSFYNAAILPMFGYPVDKHLIGSCYGLISVSGGISMMAAPLLVGKLIDTYGYNGAIIFFFSASAACFICTICVWIQDKRSTGILSMTPTQRITFEREKELVNILDHSDAQSNFSSMQSSDLNSLTNLCD